ncbi:MAG TPA: sigma-70 family RNA polymerase sigma factor [Anaerovoracaceae bacterium]|nr:sigma-70 family RNA polymerase sigma factor [Anaerovoracaceae bacterium]
MEHTEEHIEVENPKANSLLQAYMREVNSFKLFSETEEKSLTQEYFGTQNQKLRKKLINHNLRLVVKIAFEYRAAYGNLMDMIQEGNLGLMKGVDKYDPTFGVPLAHYSAKWIRAYMLRFIINNARLVKLGTTEAQRKLFFNLAKEKARLEAQGFEVSDALLAEKLKVDEKELSEMGRRLSAPDASIDADNADGNGSSRVFNLEDDRPAPDQAFERAEVLRNLKGRLAEFRKNLSVKNAVVFDRRLMADEPDTFEVIGVEIGVTRQRVQQIEAALLTKLHTYLRNNHV